MNVVMGCWCEEELAVVAATTEIETRKLNEWQGLTGDNGGPGMSALIVPWFDLSLMNPF